MRSTYSWGAVLALAIAAGGVTWAPPVVQTVEIDKTSLSLQMINIPAGPVGDVQVGSFSISRTEISWDLMDVFIYGLDQTQGDPRSAADAVTRPSKPYISMDRGFGHRGYPAISVSYLGAQAFCQWISAKTGDHYRLPTELEWRRACQLGDISTETLDGHAWHKGNADFKTHPVGTKQADAVGLYDMYGNAAEWVTSDQGKPVTVGGSYRDKAEALGCTSRVLPVPEWNASDPQLPKSKWWLADGGFVGFRVVRVSDGNEEQKE
jgi:formylglycine-generating enzyme required for sulfatase activity